MKLNEADIIRQFLPKSRGGEGKTVRQIASAIGCHSIYIRLILKRLNLVDIVFERGAGKFTPELRKQVVEMYTTMKCENIATILGIGVNTVLRILAEEGIEFETDKQRSGSSPGLRRVKYLFWGGGVRDAVLAVPEEYQENLINAMIEESNVESENIALAKAFLTRQLKCGPKQYQRTLTDEEKASSIHMVTKEKRSVRDIAADLNISENCLRKSLGWERPIPNARIEDKQVKEALEMRLAGENWCKISRTLGFHRSSIKRAIERYKITIQPC